MSYTEVFYNDLAFKAAGSLVWICQVTPQTSIQPLLLLLAFNFLFKTLVLVCTSGDRLAPAHHKIVQICVGYFDTISAILEWSEIWLDQQSPLGGRKFEVFTGLKSKSPIQQLTQFNADHLLCISILLWESACFKNPGW